MTEIETLLLRFETTLIVIGLLMLLMLPLIYAYEKAHPICQNPDGTTIGCASDIPDPSSLPIR